MTDDATGSANATLQVEASVQIQILATEHWSLLATRNLTWGEMFSRASIFITVLSASVVSLALVAQATDFGLGARVFALLVLPVVAAIGLLTFVRLGQANTDDIGLVIGMNRLRRGYLEIAPHLEQYFITASHDDQAGVLRSYGAAYRRGPARFLAGTPALVGIVNAVLAGVIASVVIGGLTDTVLLIVAAGILGTLALGAVEVAMVRHTVARGRSGYQALFPGPSESEE